MTSATSAPAGCAATRSRFFAYRDETLARDERTAVRDHIGACAACRGEAARFDPVLLFAAMPQETVSAAEAAEILAAVRSGIALKTAEKRIEGSGGARLLSPARRISATAAAVAAAVVLAWTSGPGAALRTAPAEPGSLSAATAARRSSSQPASFPAGLRPSNASPNASVDGARETPMQTPGQMPAGADPSALPFGEASGPAKGNLPADATIYDWNPGGGQPRVVWIVDRSLDI